MIEIGPEILDFYRVSSNLVRSFDKKILSGRLSDSRIFANPSNITRKILATMSILFNATTLLHAMCSVPWLLAMIQQSHVILTINEAWRNYFII